MSRESERPLLTLIIPAYNEGRRLPGSLAQIADFVEAQDYETEVIVVNNNSADRTPQVVEEFARMRPYVRLLHEPTQGKGAAVRTGMMAGRGEYLFICDADLSMPIQEVQKFMPPALNGYDVAIASREAEGARRYNEPEYRHIMGRVFNLIVRLLAVPGIQDTQCGFKVFRREVALDVFSAQTLAGWAFDVEVLYIARRRGYRLVEVPINMLLEVLRVRLNDLRGVYSRRA
jgi:dolichyl-phosphate beta-glucosyltransferase